MTQLVLPGLEEVSDYHRFKESLQVAQINSTLMQLEIFYKSCFPGVIAVSKVTSLELQRQGIDTIVEFEGGKKVYFDEKIRQKDYGDILLEEYSIWRDYPLIIPRTDGLEPIEVARFEIVPADYEDLLVFGWINGQKKTDYITYVVKPSKRVYFLPFLLLQRAWAQYHHVWLRRFGRMAAPNRYYWTTNIPIPVDTLFRALFESADWTN